MLLVDSSNNSRRHSDLHEKNCDYLCNRSTDFDEMYSIVTHIDGIDPPPDPNACLKIQMKNNQRWRTTAIL